MTRVMGTHVRYKPDNSKVKGFGALLMSPGVSAVAFKAARDLAKHIPIAAATADQIGPSWGVEPGWISRAFANVNFRPSTTTIISGGHRNRRHSVRVEVDTPHGNVHGAPVQSSAVTLEFGSQYNEGTKTDRPAFGVLASAARAYIATQPPGGRAAVRIGPLRVPRA